MVCTHLDGHTPLHCNGPYPVGNGHIKDQSLAVLFTPCLRYSNALHEHITSEPITWLSLLDYSRVDVHIVFYPLSKNVMCCM